jgi:hypothetical protein
MFHEPKRSRNSRLSDEAASIPSRNRERRQDGRNLLSLTSQAPWQGQDEVAACMTIFDFDYGATIPSSTACRWSKARKAGSHLRGDRVFAVSGLGAPVRSEIGPYQALMKSASRLRVRNSLWLRLKSLTTIFFETLSWTGVLCRGRRH